MSTEDKQQLIEDSNILYGRKRLVAISNSLSRMKKDNQSFLESFELTNDYRLFRNALLSFQFQRRLKDLVEFKTCDNIDEEKSYFYHEERKITICSNKVKNQDEFNQLMKYNLVYLYDDLRAQINWTDCSQIACMQVLILVCQLQIRAINLANYCKVGDTDCFQNRIKHSFGKFELCKGKHEECFKKVFKTCIKDISPINTMHNNKSGSFF